MEKLGFFLTKNKSVFVYSSVLGLAWLLTACGRPGTNATIEEPLEQITEDVCVGLNEEACALFKLTNKERTRMGLDPFKPSARCREMAQEQADDMATYDYFDHDRPARGKLAAESFQERVERFNLLIGASENIAIGATPEEVMKMWINSPSHRAHMLKASNRSLGIGVKNGRYVQVFWMGAGD